MHSSASILLTSLVTLAVEVAGQKITVPAVPTWPAGLCTDKSLTIPSWVISDYQVSASETTTFSVANRAIDSHGSVTCTTGQGCAVTGNPSLAASVSSSTGSPVVTLEESWTCDDLGKIVAFNATGSTTVFSLEPSSSGGSTSPITYLAYGTLSEPVPLTPAQPTPPPGYSLSTCADVSLSPALFTVSSVTFANYTTTQCRRYYGSLCIDPATNPIYSGLYLNATVANEAIEHTISCSLKLPSSPSDPLPATPVRCTGGNFNEIALDLTLTGSAPHFTIAVEQLWYCLESPQTNVQPSVILAAGSAALDLSCTTTAGITGQADDLITTCSQSPSALGIKGTTEDKQAQPAYSLVTALPTTGGCTVASVVDPEWTISNPQFQTNFENSTTDQSLWLAGLELATPGYDHWFYGFIGEEKLPGADDPATWYQCEWSVPGDWLPWACQFQYNYHTATLGLDTVWECNEKDPQHPLYFHGTGSVTFPEEGRHCANDNPNIITCYYSGGWQESYPVPQVTVSLTNVEPPRSQ